MNTKLKSCFIKFNDYKKQKIYVKNETENSKWPIKNRGCALTTLT